jgi:abortive infection bacteriophage resistance protein
MAYNRPWKSFEEQLALLRGRGLQVDDEPRAVAWLQRIGYYRLSAYSYPFRVFRLEQDVASGAIRSVRTDAFVAGTAFEDVLALYVFDRKLRLLLADALERIEVSLRVEVAYRLGKADTFAHLHGAAFHPSFRDKRSPRNGGSVFDDWQAKYQGLVARSREDFVEHYRETHGPDLPIWVAIEVWDFGAVSQLLGMMKVPDQQHIARRYGVEDWKVFGSWVRSLSYLRNLVAHHSRVWNRNMVSEPRMPVLPAVPWTTEFSGKQDLLAKPFVYMAIARHLVQVVSPGSHWHRRLADHLAAFPAQSSQRELSVAAIGAPEGWEAWWFGDAGK